MTQEVRFGAGDDAWACIRSAARQLADALNIAAERVGHILTYAEHFGENGWPLPPDWDIADVASVVDALADVGIDRAFAGYYESNGGERLWMALDDMKRDGGMSRWEPLIADLEVVMRQGHSIVAVPCLLTVLEGVVFPGADIRTNVPRAVEAILLSQESAFEKLIWQTIYDYITLLFGSVRFDKSEPHLNRHWVLHGRSSTKWDRVDCIRLLHGIRTIRAAQLGRCLDWRIDG